MLALVASRRRALQRLPGVALAGVIDLRIAFRAQEGSPPRMLVLRCAAAQLDGTVRDPAAACRRLQRLGASAFARRRGVSHAPQIFGGPSTARVTGHTSVARVWVRLRATDGCEIARWQRVAFLLPTRSPT